MSSLGDMPTGSVLYDKFTTYRPSTGVPHTLAGSPVVSVYKNNSTTQSTAGVTLVTDFDGMTGCNHVTIDTSADGAFYTTGGFYTAIITTGTVDGGSAVGTPVCSFSLNAGAAYTVANDFSAVAAGRFDDVDAATANIQSRLPAALIGGRMDSHTGAMANNVMTAAAAASDLTTELQAGLATAASIAALNNISAAQVNAEVDAALADVGLTTTVTGRIDAAISTRLATAGYTAPLDAAGTRAAVGLASANLDTQLADIPTVTEMNARTLPSADYATATALATVDTVADGIKAQTDKFVNLPVFTAGGTGGQGYGAP